MPKPVKKPKPADLIAQWLYLDPKLFPVARKIASGSDYAYGDAELSEWVYNLMYDTGSNAVDLLWIRSYNASVSAATHVRSQFPTDDAFLAVDWAAVRTALLSPGKV
jgi:hypothetical protein